nr:immunoglobulin light chain junction region [Macaca mulatta]
CQQFKNFPLTF